jgi:ABC-type nitrate/sulfonate/bicarbonate transport system permease component
MTPERFISLLELRFAKDLRRTFAHGVLAGTVMGIVIGFALGVSMP